MLVDWAVIVPLTSKVSFEVIVTINLGLRYDCSSIVFACSSDCLLSVIP
jgi:hypothetical protein